jgi:hypothetical protein
VPGKHNTLSNFKNQIMPCQSSCFESTIETCNDIIIRANFPAAMELYWILRKIGSTTPVQRIATTDGDGYLTIPIAQLPDGYLQAGNFYTIEIRDGGNYLQSLIFEFGGVEYDCITVELVNFNRETDDGSDINVIQFNSATLPGGGGGELPQDGHEEFPAQISTSTTINLLENYISGSVRIHRNGSLLPNSSYTQASLNSITLNFVRVLDDELIIDYKF